jgi:integrase
MVHKKKAILSKARIAEFARSHRDGDQDIVVLALMAEKQRRAIWAAKKAKKRKPKKYLRSTYYLSIEQFAKVMAVVKSQADAARAKSKYLSRAVINEMLIIIMAETGLRAAEICNLKLKDLPGYHGKQEIEVRQGKGGKDRTVGISRYLASRLTDYTNCYHKYRSEESWLLRNERGGAISYQSVYSKIKGIGLETGIWLYRKSGKVKSRLIPHKFRHTYATFLLDVSDNEFLVQSQLGHEQPDTTQIYARTLSAKLRKAMDGLHNRLWEAVEAEKAQDL